MEFKNFWKFSWEISLNLNFEIFWVVIEKKKSLEICCKMWEIKEEFLDWSSSNFDFYLKKSIVKKIILQYCRKYLTKLWRSDDQRNVKKKFSNISDRFLQFSNPAIFFFRENLMRFFKDMDITKKYFMPPQIASFEKFEKKFLWICQYYKKREKK